MKGSGLASFAMGLLLLSNFSFANSLYDRARGSLWGTAYGDALGIATESLTAQQIADIFGSHDTIEDLPIARIYAVLGKPGLERARPPGFTSDDTQQSLALLLTYLHYPSWDREALKAWAGNLVAGFNPEALAWRGVGSSFTKAVENLKNGVHFTESGSPAPSTGAAMRVIPMAGLVHFPEETVERAVLTSSMVTHADLRAVIASYAVYKAANLLIQGYAPAGVRQALIHNVRRMEERLLNDDSLKINKQDPHSFSSVLETIFARLNRLSKEQVSAALVEEGRRYLAADMQEKAQANRNFAVLAGVHALALALMDNVNPLETVRYIVNLGDDTDTVAAMAGGLLGARLGSEWVPKEQLYDRERLSRYAEALVQEPTGSGAARVPENFTEFFAEEVRQTSIEKEFQLVQVATCELDLVGQEATGAGYLPFQQN